MPTEPWADLVSPRVGLIRSLCPQTRAPNEPEPPHLWMAVLSNFDFRMADRNERIVAGKGATASAAMAAAAGEAVERYCASHWAADRTFLAPLHDVATRSITPADCVLYAEEQYAREDWPFPRWDADGPTTWIEGVGIPDGEPVALPAGLVHLVFPAPRYEDSLAPSTSNGLAAGANLENAVFGGLCELMERDALMIAWMNRLAAVELEIEDAGGTSAALVRHYRALDVEVRAFALATDLPATAVLALACENTPGTPATVTAMGCHPAPAIALEKALFELCQARPAEFARFGERSRAERPARPEDVKSLNDHSAFAALPEQRDAFEFLWRDGGRAAIAALEDRSAPDTATMLKRCGRALADLGHRAAYVELTTPDIEPTGYRVVRVIAAGLQPIHFGFGQERLGGDRLFDLPRRLGLATRRTTIADLNRCPHPMA